MNSNFSVSMSMIQGVPWQLHILRILHMWRLRYNTLKTSMRSVSKGPVLPASDDAKAALETLEALSGRGGASAKGAPVRLQFRSRTGALQNVPLAPLPFKLLVEVLKQLAAGNAVSIVPLRKEVTTYEAAEILNVSRPFVIGLLEKGEIPFRKVGAHRRIPLSALLEYKRKTDAIRDEALDFLAAQAQELKLY
jgi:excisionase family DNA binding protein